MPKQSYKCPKCKRRYKNPLREGNMCGSCFNQIKKRKLKHQMRDEGKKIPCSHCGKYFHFRPKLSVEEGAFCSIECKRDYRFKLANKDKARAYMIQKNMTPGRWRTKARGGIIRTMKLSPEEIAERYPATKRG